MLRAQSWLGGKRVAAVALMTLLLLMLLVAPFYLAIRVVAQNIEQVANWSNALKSLKLPQLPGWVQTLPLVGAKLTAGWQQIASAGPEELSARIAPFAHTAARWFLSQVGNLGLLFVQLLLTVVIAGILYANGEGAGAVVVAFSGRLAGAEGEKSVRLAAQAIRGVALGIVVTATIQAVFGGIGLAVAGVPFAVLLTALMLILSIAQIGAVPVLAPAVIWIYYTRGGLWGTGLLVWSIFSATIDNFLRPILIKRGANLPLLLVFVGVIGGLVGFGVIGLFIGPVVLAVAYTLFFDWLSDDADAASPDAVKEVAPTEHGSSEHPSPD
jgi:predicted PurR-regulated permease PerM